MKRRDALALALANAQRVRNGSPALPSADHVSRLALDDADAVLEHLDKPVELKGPDLEAMPDLSVVMDDNTDVSQKRGGEWCGYEAAPMSSTRLARFGPFRILHIGKAIPDEHDEAVCSGGGTMCHECLAAAGS